MLPYFINVQYVNTIATYKYFKIPDSKVRLLQHRNVNTQLGKFTYALPSASPEQAHLCSSESSRVLAPFPYKAVPLFLQC